ncbi:MAG: LCP family protein [Erysipelotrichaceae bacterium]|nr:LCP family protein [Erysipelotrichaceae bacterium]
MRRYTNHQSKTVTVLSWLFVLLFIASAGYIAYEAFRLEIFSTMQLVIGYGVLALVLVLFICLLLKRYYRHWIKGVVMVFTFALSCTCVLGGYYMQKTGDFFESISTPTATTDNTKKDDPNADTLNSADVLNQMALSVTTYAMQGSNIHNPSELNGTVTGVVTALDERGTNGALEQLRKAGATPVTQEYESSFALVDALYRGEVNAIILPEQFHEELLEAANDYNQYNALTTMTNKVDQYIYYVPVPDEMKNPADDVMDITEEPFTVLISGSDSYGNLSTISRSDVNMLVSVNPKTYQVLMISLPRDSYIPISCKKNAMACSAIAGQSDKLTHTGWYGIGTTESTIEDYLGIEVNYTVRVNFSSLINIVDAIGGIDVYVEPGLEVETFYANGMPGVQAGVNHLEGERALAFARERHAYLSGDNQRIINQQLVLRALLEKMMSPSMVVNYPNFIRALSTAFTTNMSGTQIKELIGLEISSFPSWNIQSYALSGDSTMAFCPAIGSEASVLVNYIDTVNTAQSLIFDLIEGKTIDVANPSGQTTESNTQTPEAVDPNANQGVEQYPAEQQYPVEPQYPEEQYPTYPDQEQEFVEEPIYGEQVGY